MERRVSSPVGRKPVKLSVAVDSGQMGCCPKRRRETAGVETR